MFLFDEIMISRTVVGYLFIHSLFAINLANCYATVLGDVSNSVYTSEDRDYLDIIIDNTHAYTYLSYTDYSGKKRSIYSSLMPKSNATRKNLEGIDRFPIILDCLLKDDHLQEFSIDEIPESLSFKELVSAFLFAIYYLFSNYIETGDEGKIVGDQPIRREIKIQRRFYLTPEQTIKAKAIINQNFIESYKGNIQYDALKYNCVDYVRDVYTAIGLNETQGEFFSQFDAHKLDNNDSDVSFSLLKIYEAHSNGDIGPLKVAKAIWNGIRMLSLIK